MIALAQLVLLGVGIIAMLAIALVIASRSVARHGFDRLPPASTVVALEALVALPWVLPFIVIGLALAPSLAALAWPGADHCGLHGDHHHHLCFVHPPGHATSAGWIVLGIGAAWALARLGRTAAREARAHSAVRALLRAARPAPDGTWRLPTARVICAVAGVREPIVLVSDGARARLDAATLQIALAHERAHVVRRDVARQALARLLACAHGRLTAAWLLEALAVARERACDERAAIEHERPDVAAAVLRCARVMDAAPGAMAGFGPGVLEARVRGLLEEEREPLRASRVAIVATGMSLAALASVPAVHHALETLLGVLAH